ncbi:unnamed protein product [Oncorhynchus mykiss]|uniref:Uncharacterized protein n=1 Tax=Oncorhynchus mykiss TaxID=8022 RepID=A0A060XAN5_ONCMY|nr:unnamed protein product [Oncorhynchus mykiss]
MTEYKQCSYSLHKAIKQAKHQYRDKVESQFNGSDTRGMWQGLQSIMDFKKKTSPVTDQDVLLPDRLNNFFARFEDNTVPLTRPATKTCGFSFTAANVNKTFKRVNPRKAAGPDGISSRILRACADQLAGVLVKDHITSTPPDTLDPLQFAYRPNRSTDDAIATTLHTALTHLEKRNTYVRMLFFDYSSAFNTIALSKLVIKLEMQLGTGLPDGPPPVPRHTHHRQTELVHPHRQHCEKCAAAPLQPQEAEEIQKHSQTSTDTQSRASYRAVSPPGTATAPPTTEPELMESLEGKEDSAFNQVCEEKSKVQNVIPQQLLDQYLSMTDPAQAQTVDTEIAKHCAFSLPGVALTLGRQNWHCLKDTYETLATDVQWKVRRTLAFSIHDLALILGDQLTAADLVPIFNGFLKDLDEVRIGVLKHLYDFLKLLHAENRREYLYQLQEFMVTDNSRNWRFRYQLAEQLILIMELYSHDDVYNYLRQIALTLCSDKVSEVRWISYQLVVEILQKMYACGAHELGLNFSNELIVRFCHCPKWVGRQAFAFICQAIVEEDCMPMDQFAQHLLPSLLSLSLDPVANVRVLVAKALRQSVMEKAYFKEPGSAYLEELEETVMTLQADKDRDVRFFASLDPDMVLMDTSALI